MVFVCIKMKKNYDVNILKNNKYTFIQNNILPIIINNKN